MKKRPYALLMLALLLAELPLAAVAGEDPDSALKDAFANAFRVGAALNREQIMGEEPATLALVALQFNSITAENVMKWERIHPEEDRYDWAAPDALVDFAATYLAARDRELESAAPEPGYIDGGTGTYECIARVEDRFYRLLIYRSCHLHCGQIPAGMNFSTDPRRGRLTANVFVSYAPGSWKPGINLWGGCKH